MAGKFARSWGLMKASAAVLRSDKALLAFPLLSGLCSLVVAASFLLPVALAVIASDGHALDRDRWSPATWLLMFAFYLVQYFVIVFFNTALAGCALRHPLSGRSMAELWAAFPQESEPLEPLSL